MIREKVAMSQGFVNSPTSDPSVEQVQLRIRGLQHEVEKSATLVRRLAVLAGLLVLLLIALVIALHLYHVMQYAEVSSVEANSVPGGTGTAEIVYTPKSAGKIEFVRESEGLLQTVTEYANDPNSSDKSNGHFTWSGADQEKSSFRATYRQGLFLVTKDLSVRGAGIGN